MTLTDFLVTEAAFAVGSIFLANIIPICLKSKKATALAYFIGLNAASIAIAEPIKYETQPPKQEYRQQLTPEEVKSINLYDNRFEF